MTTHPHKTGIGLRSGHIAQIIGEKPPAGFLEAHSENYFRIGGAPFEQLMACRKDYPLSLHGVGLSLGTATGVNAAHLQKLKALVDIAEPLMVSEHIAWSAAGGIAVPDLLPLPLTQETCNILCRNISVVQEKLGRRILVENPSAYMAFTHSEMREPEMIAQVVKTTGCGLLLDINNIHVSAHNLGFEAQDYLNALPQGIVEEIHLAGFQPHEEGAGQVLIDAHNSPVDTAVWNLYAAALARFGDTPTLIEWDSALPPLARLLTEAQKADDYRAALPQKQKDKHARTA